MCYAALLELRQKKQAERLQQEDENSVARNKCEQAAENGQIVKSVFVSEEEPCDDTPVSSEQNARGDGEVVDIQSETGEVSCSDGMMEITASTEVTLSTANTVTPSRLDHFEQTDKLKNSVNKAEQREHHTTTADQSVCIKLPSDDYREVLQPTDGKLNEVQDIVLDDIDVIDLSNMAPQCTSISQHVPVVCFEVCVLQTAVLCILKVE